MTQPAESTRHRTLSTILRKHIHAENEKQRTLENTLTGIVVAMRKALGVNEALFRFRLDDSGAATKDMYAAIRNGPHEKSIVVAIDVAPDPVNGAQAVTVFLRIAVMWGSATDIAVHYADAKKKSGNPTSSEFVHEAANAIADDLVAGFPVLLGGMAHVGQLWIEPARAD